MTEEMILNAVEGAVATLTLNRPDRRNCLSLEMLDRLHAEISGLGADPDVRAIVVAANGPAFCSGHDLKELTAARNRPDRGREFFETTMGRCAETMQAIISCPKPVIAAVQGVASAAGCQLVATCDLAIASEGAVFATPGVHIGLFCSTPMVALSRNVGRKHAMEMLLTGQNIDAARAEVIGLVNRVVPAEDLRTETTNVARTIASKSPAVVRTGKEAFYSQVEMPLTEAYEFTSRIMVENMLFRDAKEGIGAFLEKREPQWRGK